MRQVVWRGIARDRQLVDDLRWPSSSTPGHVECNISMPTQIFSSRNITIAIELPHTGLWLQTHCCCKHAKGTKVRSDCSDSPKQEMLQRD
jgi:hypothetical protein